MKRLFIFTIVFTLLFSLHAQQKNSQYALKSGHVVYEQSGNTTGVKEIWWDNYGELQCTEIKSTTITKFFGTTTEKKTHTLSITKKNQFWIVDYIEKTAQKGTNPGYQQTYEVTHNMTEAEQKKFADDLLASLGGERLGTETLIGRKCEIVSVLGFKSWIYLGVILKTEGNLFGVKTNEIATKFEENCTLPSSTFNPPTDVQYTDTDMYTDTDKE